MLNPRISEHEQSHSHEEASMKWKELCMRLEKRATIDHDIQRQTEQNKETWRNILKRILDGILFISQQNLSFPGHRENLSSNATKNPGNFLH